MSRFVDFDSTDFQNITFCCNVHPFSDILFLNICDICSGQGAKNIRSDKR